MSPIRSSISLFSFLLLITLSGCGFEPLYAPQGESFTMAQMKDVHVDIIADRPGQVLRNFLLDTMTEKNHADTRYTLEVILNESIRKLGFRKDGTARHEEMLIRARFKLIDNTNNKVVFEDGVTETASFSLGPEAQTASYSSNIAEESSREKALRIIAHTINLYVANYLQNKDLK